MDSARNDPAGSSNGASDNRCPPQDQDGSAEGAWADVETAQRSLQERFRPRWWFRAPEAVLFAGLIAMIAGDALGPLYWCLLIILILLRYLYLGVQRAEPASGHGVSTITKVALVVVVAILLLGVLGAWGPAVQEAMRQGWWGVGLVCGLLGYLLMMQADRRHQRLLGTMGERLAAGDPTTGRPPAPRRHEVLDEPEALRAMMLLGSVREMERGALQEDLGLPPEQTARLLEELRRLRLVDAHRKLIAGGWRRTWLVLTTTGLSALSRHLAALDDTTRQESP